MQGGTTQRSRRNRPPSILPRGKPLGRPHFRRSRRHLLTFALWRSVLAVQYRGEVMLQRLSDRAHLQRIRELVAVDPEAPAKGGHFFRGWCQTDLRGGHVELD